MLEEKATTARGMAMGDWSQAMMVIGFIGVKKKLRDKKMPASPAGKESGEDRRDDISKRF